MSALGHGAVCPVNVVIGMKSHFKKVLGSKPNYERTGLGELLSV